MHKQRRHQRGYLRCVKRKKGPAKWEFLWREVGPSGELIRRTTVIGSIEQYPTEESASAAINGLRVSVNDACNRQFHKSVVLATLPTTTRRQSLESDQSGIRKRQR
jgi:hypothetical protein